jgi:hypothetical protein
MIMYQHKKRVLMGILAAGIITTTISILGMAKVFNFAAAQFQVPFQTQPRLQQQQPSAATTTAAAPTGGPPCNGCITTQNLANGAVTNPKLAVPSVATGNIANGAVTSDKLAAGAVSLNAVHVSSGFVGLSPGDRTIVSADCPTGTIVTGGGYSISQPGGNSLYVEISDRADTSQSWLVKVSNVGSSGQAIAATAVCTSIH